MGGGRVTVPVPLCDWIVCTAKVHSTDNRVECYRDR